MHTQTTVAILVVLVIIIVAAMFCVGGAGPEGFHRQSARAGREGYLIYPYLDLEEPGERGSYYAMSECD